MLQKFICLEDRNKLVELFFLIQTVMSYFDV